VPRDAGSIPAASKKGLQRTAATPYGLSRFHLLSVSAASSALSWPFFSIQERTGSFSAPEATILAKQRQGRELLAGLDSSSYLSNNNFDELIDFTTKAVKPVWTARRPATILSIGVVLFRLAGG
jgi:hypothetical protein